MKKEKFEIQKSKGECYFCGKSIEKMGISVWNKNKNYNFRFLPKEKGACLECYIEAGVKQSIKKEYEKR
uniref:Uncharacterized protein n=1 Tax=viral metagenome TaxID=1070528 RepID=A0A6M3KX90_9ZZZZ